MEKLTLMQKQVVRMVNTKRNVLENAGYEELENWASILEIPFDDNTTLREIRAMIRHIASENK